MNPKVKLPPVIFGTSCLGNIYEATSYEDKFKIVKACIENAPGGKAVFDTAGKYGAGLALETLGKSLQELKFLPDEVIISNKLGWYQTKLTTPEPTFERDIWKGLKHDAIQKISYEGIQECYEQGNKLLGNYKSQMVSVHDPDEYLDAATDKSDEEIRFTHILNAYKALFELKEKGQVSSVGIGAKNWKAIKRISEFVDLDWIMIANSLTVFSHPKDLLTFLNTMHKKNVTIINSAVFNGGFLIGSDYFNYVHVDKQTERGKYLYQWRNDFFSICKEFNIEPATACFNFAFNLPCVDSIALSTKRADRVGSNVMMATKLVPYSFWEAMADKGLIKLSDIKKYK